MPLDGNQTAAGTQQTHLLVDPQQAARLIARKLQTLCLRFTVHAEPGITDQEEKEAALRWLVDARRDAIAPVSAFVQEQESGIAWGLRALAEVARPEEVLAVVTAELARLGTVYTRDPEKKLTLLAWAARSSSSPGSGSTSRTTT